MIDKYLETIQEEEINESALAAAGILAGVVSFFSLLFVGINKVIAGAMRYSAIKSTRNKKLESILNPLLNQEWKIYNWKMKFPNACVMSNRKEIFITNTLTKMLTERETIAICIHETSHVNNKDINKRVVINSITGGIGVPSMVFPPLSLLVFFVGTFITIWIGRKQETKADLTTVKYGYGKDLISSFKKLHNWMDKNQKQSKFSKKLTEMVDVHPPIKDRIEDLLQEIDKLKSLKSFKQVKTFVKSYFKIKK